MSRAKIILEVQTEPWDLKQAEAWVYQRADNHDYSESTINKWFQTFNALARCFSWNWSEFLMRIKENCLTPELLSDDEILDFYNLHTKDKYDLAIKLEITTGARPSEILHLQGKDIDLSRKVITLNHTKTKNSRLLFIQDFLLEELQQYLENNHIGREDYLFGYRNHKSPLDIKSLENEIRKRLEILGISKNITPYCLRHSFITRMAAVTNAIQLQELAGHKRIQTTLKYTHNNEYMLRETAKKDFIFDGMRSFADKISAISDQIEALSKNKDADPVKLQEAKLCLLQAVKTNP